MEKTSSLQDLTLELYAFLARRFPVCCWSDEFVFFPQAVEEEMDWSRWDDFSPGSVEDAVTSLGWFRRRLGEFAGSDNEVVREPSLPCWYGLPGPLRNSSPW